MAVETIDTASLGLSKITLYSDGVCYDQHQSLCAENEHKCAECTECSVQARLLVQGHSQVSIDTMHAAHQSVDCTYHNGT